MIDTAFAFLRRLGAALRARRTLWMALGALGFGALAVIGARNYIGERLARETARLQPRQEMVEVVVARRDLKRGDPVGPETMAVRSLPREYAPSSAVVPSRFDAVSGARLLVAMRAGEPLMPTAVSTADAGAISSRVRPGVRAMTIAVDEVNSLSGMLQPGDRIDLLLTVRPAPVAGQVQPEITRTVMQGVPVLATGRQSRALLADEPGAGRPYTAITVEVEPDQAQRLVVAQRSGRLTAVLRNPDDRATVAEPRLDVNALLGLPPAAPPTPAAPPPAPPAPTLAQAAPAPVEIIVGGRGPVPAHSGAAMAAGASGAASDPSVASATASLTSPFATPTPAAASATPPAVRAMPPGPAQPTPSRATAPSSLEEAARSPAGEGGWTPPATVPLYR